MGNDILLPETLRGEKNTKGTFRVQTGQSNFNHQRHCADVNVVSDFWAQIAIDQILAEFGDVVRIAPASLLKFGKTTNALVDNSTTIATLQDAEINETYPTTNSISHIISIGAADTQILTVEGHTIDGNGDFIAVTQTKALNGQTKVALDTPLARVSRAFTTDPTSPVGPVAIFDDGPTTLGKADSDPSVHLIIAAGKNHSQKAASVCSKGEYAFITSLTAAIDRQGNANADIELEVRPKGEGFRPVFEDSIRSSTAGRLTVNFKPYIIVPSSADIRVVATATATSTIVTSYNQIMARLQTTSPF